MPAFRSVVSVLVSFVVRSFSTNSSVPLRRVRTGELRREEFLYELKAGPAGGRLRRPSSRRQRHGGQGRRPNPHTRWSTSCGLTCQSRPSMLSWQVVLG
jgi:hypothetical protein